MPVAGEIPLLSSFPYLLDEAERVWSRCRRIRNRVALVRSRSTLAGGVRRLRQPITEFLNQAQAGRWPGVTSGCHRFGGGISGPASSSANEFIPERDPTRGPRQAGSSTGAVHLSKNNAGVLRSAQRGQKPRSEQKGKSRLDLDVQHA